jgi:hypothetical protein
MDMARFIGGHLAQMQIVVPPGMIRLHQGTKELSDIRHQPLLGPMDHQGRGDVLGGAHP